MGQGYQVLQRLWRAHPQVADGALALLLLVAGLLQITYPHRHDPRGLTNNGFFAIAILVVFTGGLLWRRRYPLGAMAVVFVPAFLGPFFHLTDSEAEFTAFQVLVYTSIAVSRRGQLRPYAAAAMAVAVDLSHINPDITPVAIVGYNLALSVVPLAAGFTQRGRRRLTAELEIQQAKLVEQGRRLAAQVIVEERARIASELNRVVMACVEDMAAAAERALECLRAGQQAAVGAIGQIEASGRMALLELRRVLGLLRAGDGMPLAPRPVPARDRTGERSRRRWLRRLHLPGPAWDLLIVAGLSVSGVYELLSPITGPGPHAALTQAQTVVLAIAMALPLIARRRFPMSSLVVVVAIQQALGMWLPLYLTLTADAIILVAIFTVAASRSSEMGAAAGLLGMTVAFAGFPTWVGLQGAKFVGGAIAHTILFAFAAWWGATARSANALNRRLDEANVQLEAGYELESRRVLADERSRVAREMHDAVGHSLSLMVVQAGGARAASVRSPEDSVRALCAVLSVAGQTRGELETILSLLDAPESPGATNGIPGHVDIRALVAQVRDSGMAVELLVEGGAKPITPGLGVTVYRIVQEALTNVRKHAGEATTRVQVCFLDDRLALEVVNDAHSNGRPSVSLPSGGHGLIGMRERVAAFGGRFDAGPLPAGGFRVWAEIPWTEATVG